MGLWVPSVLDDAARLVICSYSVLRVNAHVLLDRRVVTHRPMDSRGGVVGF